MSFVPPACANPFGKEIPSGEVDPAALAKLIEIHLIGKARPAWANPLRGEIPRGEADPIHRNH